MKKQLIKFKRGGKPVQFRRKIRKLKNPRIRASKKVYKRKVLRDSFGQWAGSKRVRK